MLSESLILVNVLQIKEVSIKKVDPVFAKEGGRLIHVSRQRTEDITNSLKLGMRDRTISK